MQTLSFLHISDLHIARDAAFYKTVRFFARPLSVYNRNALTAIAEFAYRRRDRIDAIILSGDIVTSAVDRNLQRGFDFFKTPAHSFPDQPWLNSKREPTLSFFDKPIIAVPGNHDRYEAFTAWPSSKFDAYFPFIWNKGFGGINVFPLPNAQSPILGIISADFALEKKNDSGGQFFGSWGQGRVYDHRLQELKNKTESWMNEHPECAVLWLIHFAPKFEEYQPKFNKNKMLINSDALIATAKKVGVERILCGHTHESAFYKIPKNEEVSVHCVGTSCCSDEQDGAKIHLYDITLSKCKIIQIKTLQLAYNRNDSMFL